MTYKNLSQKQVEKLAEKLALEFKKTGAIIGFSGTLGAGKTTFIKAFAKQLGIKSIKSPTFIVAARHKLKDRYLFHIDFYRLHKPSELDPLELPELLVRPNIVLIEWIEKFPKLLKAADLLIKIRVAPGNKRDVEIKSN